MPIIMLILGLVIYYQKNTSFLEKMTLGKTWSNSTEHKKKPTFFDMVAQISHAGITKFSCRCLYSLVFYPIQCGKCFHCLHSHTESLKLAHQ